MPGTIFSWGFNDEGQLGDGSAASGSSVPVAVKGVNGVGLLTGVEAVSAGRHSLALRSDGTLFTWGDNTYGELGDGTFVNRNTPVQVKGVNGVGVLGGIKAVCAGRDSYPTHSLALAADGTVLAWGANTSGQLGDGTTMKRSTPGAVKGSGGIGVLGNIAAVGGGAGTSFAVAADGTVLAWGDNYSGALGDGTTTPRSVPAPVKGPGGIGELAGIEAVSASMHTLALRSDGTVFAWGYNSAGQLGDGTTTTRTTPVQVKGPGGVGALSNVVAVSTGFSHSFALSSDGAVFAWGYNQNGRLGDGTTTDRTTPVPVKGPGGFGVLTNIVAVSGGAHIGSALRADGRVFTWGLNLSGLLGDGTTTDRTTPVQVVNLGNVTAVDMGTVHGKALA